MSDSEDSCPVKKSLRKTFKAVPPPSIEADKLIAIRRSVRLQKKEREDMAFEKLGKERETEDESRCKNEEKVESDLSYFVDKNSETDQETKIQDTDQLEEKMEDVGALEETDDSFKSDTIQQDDKIEEEVVNKDQNVSPQLEDNKNTKEQAETDDIMISHVTQGDEKIQTPEELGEKDGFEKNLQEHKGSEEIEISNDVDNEELHAEGSDNTDNEVKESVDDEETENPERSDVKLIIKEDKIEEKDNEDIQTEYDLESGKQKDIEENVMEEDDDEDIQCSYNKPDKTLILDEEGKEIDERKDNIMEEKEDKEMKIGQDKLDEEMITKISDDDDNDVKGPDDEENSDETQRTKITPFQIDKDLSAIMKKNFIGKSDINSNFYEINKEDIVDDFFGDIFGLHDIYSDAGFKILDKEAEGLYQYFIDLKEKVVIRNVSLKINLEDECIKQLYDKNTNMFMTTSALNIMVDGLNRYIMKKKKTEFPEVYVMQSYHIQRLTKISEIYDYMDEHEIEMEYFEKCLKHFILNRLFSNNIFAIMQKYKEGGHQLKHLLGSILVADCHFVHIAIDMKDKFILTRDPFGKGSKGSSKICKLIAKAIGIGYQIVLENKAEKEVYFGQADMQSKFVERDLKKLKEDKNITASSFKHMESPIHKYPEQNDDYNCGVVSLWYNFFS